MKKLQTYLGLIILMLILIDGYGQPAGYPPQEPGLICSQQLNASCALGASLNNLKNTVGLGYIRMDGLSKSSWWKGTVSLIRQAGMSSGSILMTAEHALYQPSWEFWIRYKYQAACGAGNPTDVTYWVDLYNNFEPETDVIVTKDLQAIKLRFADNGFSNPSKQLPRYGWTLLNQSGNTAKSLGYPRGNSMKVTSYSALFPTTNTFTTAPNVFVWQMQLDEGFIETGQSGSPVFVDNNYFIGTLIGSDNMICSSNPSGTVYAHRLSKYYRTFSDYLDPFHTGAVQVPTWLPGNIEIGEYKYPSLSKSTSTVCSGETATVSINNFCEFMDGNVLWTVSNESIVNTIESADQKTLTIVPSSSGATGPLTVTARIDFGGWYKNYSTTLQIGKINSSQISISGPYSACPNAYVSFNDNYNPGILDYDWEWGSSFQYLYGQGTRFLDLKTNGSFYGDAVLLWTKNRCGWWDGPPTVKYVQQDYNCGYYYLMSPNPTVDGTVSIEVVPDEQILEKEPDFTVQFDVEIYDSENNKIKEQRNSMNMVKIETNVLKKSGLYIVKITDKNGTISKKLYVN
jgi:hypothetical protein